jgi:hypothetical protein
MLQGRVEQDLPLTVRAPLGSLATDAQTLFNSFVNSWHNEALCRNVARRTREENLKLANIETGYSEDFLKTV